MSTCILNIEYNLRHALQGNDLLPTSFEIADCTEASETNVWELVVKGNSKEWMMWHWFYEYSYTTYWQNKTIIKIDILAIFLQSETTPVVWNFAQVSLRTGVLGVWVDWVSMWAPTNVQLEWKILSMYIYDVTQHISVQYFVYSWFAMHSVHK